MGSGEVKSGFAEMHAVTVVGNRGLRRSESARVRTSSRASDSDEDVDGGGDTLGKLSLMSMTARRWRRRNTVMEVAKPGEAKQLPGGINPATLQQYAAQLAQQRLEEGDAASDSDSDSDSDTDSDSDDPPASVPQVSLAGAAAARRLGRRWRNAAKSGAPDSDTHPASTEKEASAAAPAPISDGDRDASRRWRDRAQQGQASMPLSPVVSHHDVRTVRAPSVDSDAVSSEGGSGSEAPIVSEATRRASRQWLQRTRHGSRTRALADMVSHQEVASVNSQPAAAAAAAAGSGEGVEAAISSRAARSAGLRWLKKARQGSAVKDVAAVVTHEPVVAKGATRTGTSPSPTGGSGSEPLITSAAARAAGAKWLRRIKRSPPQAHGHGSTEVDAGKDAADDTARSSSAQTKRGSRRARKRWGKLSAATLTTKGKPDPMDVVRAWRKHSRQHAESSAGAAAALGSPASVASAPVDGTSPQLQPVRLGALMASPQLQSQGSPSALSQASAPGAMGSHVSARDDA